MAYKRRELMETLSAESSSEGVLSDENDDSEPKNENVGVVDSSVPEPSEGVGRTNVAFRAAGGLIFPGLDRGRTLWAEDNYQSSLVLKTVPVPLGGFFTNGVAGEKLRHKVWEQRVYNVCMLVVGQCDSVRYAKKPRRKPGIILNVFISGFGVFLSSSPTR